MKQIFIKIVIKFLRPYRKLVRNYLIKRVYEQEAHDYHVWATENEDRCFSVGDNEDICFSIVVPAFNTNKVHLLEMVYSVINQHHQNWELIIANASTEAVPKKYIADLENIDTRIKVVNLSDNKGISVNTNSAIEHVSGDYIVFVDHDDLLHSCALHIFASEISNTNADIVYSDEDKVSENGSKFFNPFCKPEWSLFLFENVNFINHLTTVRSNLIKDIGGLRSDYDGAQDYDILLRVIDSKKEIVISHVPRVLYHWRAAITSTARNISTKSYVLSAGEKALNKHLARRDLVGVSSAIKSRPGFYKTVYKKDEKQKVTLVIGKTNNKTRPFIAEWIESVLPFIPNLENIYVGKWFTGEEILKIKVVTYDEDRLEHLKINSGIVMYVNEAFNVAHPKEFEEIFGLATYGYVAAPSIVGGVVIHNTTYMYTDGIPRPLFNGMNYGAGSKYGSTEWVREVDVLDNSVLILPSKIFNKYIKNSGKFFIAANYETKAVLWSHGPVQNIGVFDDSLEGVNRDCIPGTSKPLKRLFKGIS